jgi:hypothetical protein
MVFSVDIVSWWRGEGKGDDEGKGKGKGKGRVKNEGEGKVKNVGHYTENTEKGGEQGGCEKAA